MAEPSTPPAVIRGRLTVPEPRGLRRGRLVQPLVTASAAPLVLVVAPAGSGKSTLLAHVAEAAACPVAWLTLEGAGADTATVLAHLRGALAARLGDLQPVWPTPDAAVIDLERTVREPLLLILDDVHTVKPCALREVVGTLIEFQPPWLRIVLGSRYAPDLDIARRRLSGTMTEIDADALRFRIWEVDELFRRCHDVHLRPREVNALTQRTAGWAAGLQLFHLATLRQPPSSRAALLATAGPGSRLTQEYLTRHVLDRVDADVRAFLIQTSVLDELTAARCDALMGSGDAAARLAALERNGLFTFSAIDGHVYRYHDVLRVHLLDELTARFGIERARALHRRAAVLLEQEGQLVEAVRSYCRAGDWDDVRRLLSTGGASLAREPGSWIDLLPESIRDHDPWVLLALARRLLADGSLDRAQGMYQRAAERFEAGGGGRAVHAELRLLQSWTAPSVGVVSDWVHVARAIVADPRRHLRRPVRLAPMTDDLLLGYAHLVSGELRTADEILARIDDDEDLPPTIEILVLFGRALGQTLAAPDGEGAATAREQALASARMLGVPAASRIADGLQAVAAGDRATIEYLLGACRRAEDRWSGALLGLLAELAALADGQACAKRLESIADDFRGLAAPALATWAAAGAALAAAVQGRPGTRSEVSEVERQARAVGPLPYALAMLATAAAEPPGPARDRARTLAVQVGEKAGAGELIARLGRLLGGPVADAPATAVPQPAQNDDEPSRPAARLRIRCLGGYVLTVDAVPVDLTPLRPRHRELLRLLSLHANRLLHREQIIEWLWPGRHPDRGNHSLQVAVSDVRRLIEPAGPDGGRSRLRREESGYRLVLDTGEDSDVLLLDQHMRAARAAARRGDDEVAAKHLEEAIATYTGELLPDDGPAEWVVAERDRLRDDVSEACERLAGIRAGQGAHAEAVRLARYGLAQDRYRDGLWQRLISSLRADGNPAAAATAAAAYQQIVTEMADPGDVADQ